MQPKITGLIDSELADWRAQVYGLTNPVVTGVYQVIPIGGSWYYTKALNAGPNSITIFVGPYNDQIHATTQMNNARHIDGF